MSEPATPAPSPAAPSALRRSGRFLWRHRLPATWTLVLLLLLTIVLQNVEPTTLDLFFWSLPDVPKLVLILISMALGAGLWEAARRVLFKRK
jgi:uncharacterized integral membrane protein